MLTFSTLLLLSAGVLFVLHKYDKMTKLVEEKEYEIESKSHMITNLSKENYYLVTKFNKLQEKSDKLALSNYRNSLKTEVFYNTESNEILDTDNLVRLGTL